MPLGSHPGTMGELATAAARGMIDAVEIGPDARRGGGGVDASGAGDPDQGGGRECTATPTGSGRRGLSKEIVAPFRSLLLRPIRNKQSAT